MLNILLKSWSYGELLSKSQSHCKYSEIQTVMNYCAPVTRVSIEVTTSCFITCKLVLGEDHIVPNKQLAVLPCAFHNLTGEKFYLYIYIRLFKRIRYYRWVKHISPTDQRATGKLGSHNSRLADLILYSTYGHNLQVQVHKLCSGVVRYNLCLVHLKRKSRSTHTSQQRLIHVLNYTLTLCTNAIPAG